MSTRRNLLFLILLGVVANSGACSPRSSSTSLPNRDESLQTGDIDNSPADKPSDSQYGIAIQTRNRTIKEAVAILVAHAEGKPVDDDSVSRSARVLGELRADNESAVQSLITNLDYEPAESFVGAPHPLECLEAAQALREIGGKKVIHGLIQSLRKNTTAKERLIIAHLLAMEYSAELAALRVRLEIDAERKRRPIDHDFINRLEAVKVLLDQPGALNNPTNWPSTAPDQELEFHDSPI